MNEQQHFHHLAAHRLRRFENRPNHRLSELASKEGIAAIDFLVEVVAVNMPNSRLPDRQNPLLVLSQTANDLLVAHELAEGFSLSLPELADRYDSRDPLTVLTIGFCQFDEAITPLMQLDVDKDTGELIGTSSVYEVFLGRVRDSTEMLLALNATIPDDDPRKELTKICAELIRQCKLPNWSHIRFDELYGKTVLRYNCPQWMPSHSLQAV